MRGRKQEKSRLFLHILEVGNDTGQLPKHAFKSLPGVQIYVSKALNAYQAFDIVFVCIRRGIRETKKTPGRKESHSKDMVIPSVPEASYVIYPA